MDNIHETISETADRFASALGTFFSWILLLFLLFLGIVLVHDFFQRRNAVLRNFPVVGHLRYILSFLGEFYRQYFGALDRQEHPFNRAQREWVNNASDNKPPVASFGSTKETLRPGHITFVPCAYPTLEKEFAPAPAVTIGPYCKMPYTTEKFFHITGMGFGALSGPAIEALSKGAAMAGIWMNSGEGGVSPYHFAGNADMILQIGTAKFGVRDKEGFLCEEKLQKIALHPQVKMIEIKLMQGAYPGHGGLLPGKKVTKEIARLREVEAGKDVKSPNRHKEINDASDLLDMIVRIRRLTGKPVGFKTVYGSDQQWEILFAEIYRRGFESAPDFITLDGSEGGTAAGPMILVDDTGMSIREALPKFINQLIAHNLRERIKVMASGKLMLPSDVAWALCMGADCINNGRGFMFALGCIQALRCANNTCPVGVATQNRYLQRGLDPANKAVRVMHYANTMHKGVAMIAQTCGVRHPRELERHHVRMIVEHQDSVGMDVVYPLP
jgi:glutamate synthase domain-containing protein 2